MDEFLDMAMALAGEALSRLADGFAAPARYAWPFLLAAGAVAALVFLVTDRGGDGRYRRLFRYLVPVKILRRTSARVDLKLYAFSLLTGIGSLAFLSSWAMLVFSLAGAGDPDASQAELGVVALMAIALILAVTYDFAEYVTHFLSHKVPVLWAFHRVHHSADVLTPMTAVRIHPMEMLLEKLITAIIAAPVLLGLYLGFGAIDIWTIAGINGVYALSTFSFTHLRHSHVWVNFPKPLCYIFSSPAQHQIHHSRQERHWDRNYGELFAVWDTVFGTLYQPERKERFAMGLSPEFGVRRPRPHATLVSALSEPFGYIAKRRAREAPTDPTTELSPSETVA